MKQKSKTVKNIIFQKYDFTVAVYRAIRIFSNYTAWKRLGRLFKHTFRNVFFYDHEINTLGVQSNLETYIRFYEFIIVP